MMTTESLGMYGEQLKLSLEPQGGIAVKKFPGIGFGSGEVSEAVLRRSAPMGR
jgi:hypothetical protein